jgi:hypothetical protein
MREANVDNLIIGGTVIVVVALGLGTALVAEHMNEMHRAHRRLSWQLCKQTQGQLVTDEFGFPTCVPRTEGGK